MTDSVLVSGSSDNTLSASRTHQLAQTDQGKPPRACGAGQPPRHQPNGSVWPADSGDNTIRLWHASTDQLSRIARA